jgi:hypothetical protein
MFERTNRSIEILLFGYFVEVALVQYTWPMSFGISKLKGGVQVVWKRYQLRLEYRKGRGVSAAGSVKLAEKLLGIKMLKSKEYAVFTFNAW